MDTHPLTGSVTDPQTRTLLTGAVVLRWAALAWGALSLVLQADDGAIRRPVLGAALLGVAAAWTLAVTSWTRRRPSLLAAPAVTALDLLVAVALVVADPVVHDGTPVQSLGSAWPLAVVVTVGVVRGPVPGAAAGLAVGTAGVVAAALGDRPGWLGPVGTAVLLATGGAVAGHVTRLLRRAESEVARARAREEVARTLHDGVLQTLAVVQRRSDDADLARLARTQELELRRFLAGPDATGDAAAPGTVGGGDLPTALRAVAQRVEERHGLRCEVVVVEAPRGMDPVVTGALCGAVGEALTNAAKHASAGVATVCLDRAEGGGWACTVKDDGVGLPPGGLVAGTGWTVSVRGRLEEVGGRAGARSTGRGTEVLLWVP